MNTSPLYRIAAAATAAEAASMRNPHAGIARAIANIVEELSELAAAASPESLPEIESAARALAAAAAAQGGSR